MLEAGRNHYILVLIRALEKRAIDGTLDEALADHIEKLLGVGKPDPAGEAEYASWRPLGVLASRSEPTPPRGNDGGEHAD